ncbi:MAG: DUF3149 domain-containing protein [Methylobacillus sp.]|jgi:hypothetical protein|nr:DUF3149 domain-containing protein [Methylobacillus sp.]
MLKVLFGSWVGIVSISTVVLTICVVSFWLGYLYVKSNSKS